MVVIPTGMDINTRVRDMDMKSKVALTKELIHANRSKLKHHSACSKIQPRHCNGYSDHVTTGYTSMSENNYNIPYHGYGGAVYHHVHAVNHVSYPSSAAYNNVIASSPNTYITRRGKHMYDCDLCFFKHSGPCYCKHPHKAPKGWYPPASRYNQNAIDTWNRNCRSMGITRTTQHPPALKRVHFATQDSLVPIKGYRSGYNTGNSCPSSVLCEDAISSRLAVPHEEVQECKHAWSGLLHVVHDTSNTDLTLEDTSVTSTGNNLVAVTACEHSDSYSATHSAKVHVHADCPMLCELEPFECATPNHHIADINVSCVNAYGDITTTTSYELPTRTSPMIACKRNTCDITLDAILVCLVLVTLQMLVWLIHVCGARVLRTLQLVQRFMHTCSNTVHDQIAQWYQLNYVHDFLADVSRTCCVGVVLGGCIVCAIFCVRWYAKTALIPSLEIMALPHDPGPICDIVLQG